ncbi:MAG: hypothetical protein AAF514_20405, partial [Verrucomicrobiota bacterium]
KSANDISTRDNQRLEADSENVSSGRLRPIVAFTSAAIGTIVMGFRRKRERIRDFYNQNQRLW